MLSVTGNKSLLLNADVGEGLDDQVLMPFIDLANIACGGHAGDEATMEHTIRLAQQHNVAAGAHPSYPDRENFGRRSIAISSKRLFTAIDQQLRRFADICQSLGSSVNHIKAHGALYNDMAYDADKALAFFKACQIVLPNAIIVGRPDGALKNIVEDSKLPYLSEGFIDRRYHQTGELVSRSRTDAVISDTEQTLAQVRQIIHSQSVTSVEGETLKLHIETLCIHGDNPNAANIAKAIAQILNVRSTAS